MGAGCNYTNKEAGTRAFWIVISYYYEDDDTGEELFDDYAWNATLESLEDILLVIGYQQETNMHYRNGLYDLFFEEGHDGILVVRLEPIGNEVEGHDMRMYNLAMANHKKSYGKLRDELARHYSLRISTSSWTSGELLAHK